MTVLVRPSIAAKRTLMSDLREAFAVARMRYRRGEKLKLGELLHALGPSSAATTAVLLSLPFAWPFSIGPLTTPLSLMILLLGWQMSRGYSHFPLPAKYLSISVPQRVFWFMRFAVMKMARRGRWNRISTEAEDLKCAGDSFRRACAFGIILGALLLAVPIPLLPLTNTFAGMAVIAFALAWMRRRNKEFLVGIVLCAVTIVYFAALAVGAYYLGTEVLMDLVPSPF